MAHLHTPESEGSLNSVSWMPPMSLPLLLLLKVHIKIMADGNAYSLGHPSDGYLTKGPESSWRAEGPSVTSCSITGA